MSDEDIPVESLVPVFRVDGLESCGWNLGVAGRNCKALAPPASMDVAKPQAQGQWHRALGDPPSSLADEILRGGIIHSSLCGPTFFVVDFSMSFVPCSSAWTRHIIDFPQCAISPCIDPNLPARSVPLDVGRTVYIASLREPPLALADGTLTDTTHWQSCEPILQSWLERRGGVNCACCTLQKRPHQERHRLLMAVT